MAAPIDGGRGGGRAQTGQTAEQAFERSGGGTLGFDAAHEATPDSIGDDALGRRVGKLGYGVFVTGDVWDVWGEARAGREPEGTRA